jgi:hypothetical protein
MITSVMTTEVDWIDSGEREGQPARVKKKELESARDCTFFKPGLDLRLELVWFVQEARAR